MSHLSWDLGGITLHRIAYLDVGVDGRQLFSVDVEQAPEWTAAWQVDGQVGLGLAFHVIESGDEVLVVDPVGAVDPFIRSGAPAIDHQRAAFEALSTAGVDRDAVTQVVLTHLDGIGMTAWATLVGDDHLTWGPAFTNARIVLSAAEHRHIAEHDDIPGREVFDLLDGAGHVDAVDDPIDLAPGVRARLTGGHSPGHLALDLDGSDRTATLVGHLAVTPFHVLDATNAGQHVDDAAGAAAQADELARAMRDDRLVGGSLWPAPGYGTVTSVDPIEIAPAAT